MSAILSHRPSLSTEKQEKQLKITLCGDWLIYTDFPDFKGIQLQVESDKNLERLIFSTELLGRWDSLLMTELIALLSVADRFKLIVDHSGLPTSIQELLKLVYAVPDRGDTQRPKIKQTWAVSITQAVYQAMHHGKQMLEFTGEIAINCIAVLRGQEHFRRMDLLLYIQQCGPSALPIVTLISLLVGLILAFVGALQLSLFGAQIYIANLVSLGMTREMGGLMTAIIMSGRTGAAYAAQLGTMHVNYEIDALKTMNLEPISFLVIPRMLALILIMPLLCLYADLMGIIGGGIVTVNLFDVSLTEYINRTTHAVHIMDFMVGFFKASVFGILIAFSGCMRGMQCGQSASAVGDAATSAVVTSMVFIVVADSVMTIICNRIGI